MTKNALCLKDASRTLYSLREGSVASKAKRAAIVLSFALQHGADVNAIRKALCRDSHGRALGPLGAALNILPKDGG